MKKLLLKCVIVAFCIMPFCKMAKADIEPFNIVVKNVVASTAETKKEISDQVDVAQKTYAQINNGFSRVKEGAKKAAEFIKDPVGSIKTIVMNALEKDDEEEAGFEAMEKTKETYGRKKGAKDNIALQKQLNKVIDKEKFDNMSLLWARALTQRLLLKEEETQEPDLSTLAAARRATTEKQINLGRRYNSILGTQAYINQFKNVIQVQNYQIEEEEE